MPRLDVEDLADVAVRPGPDQLVAPRFLDAIGEVGHVVPPNAECKMRNAECPGRRRTANQLPLQFRIPHSALRTWQHSALHTPHSALGSCRNWQAQPQ